MMKVYIHKRRYLLWALSNILDIINGSENNFQIYFIQLHGFIETKRQFFHQRDILQTFYFCEICEYASVMGKPSKISKQFHPIDAQ